MYTGIYFPTSIFLFMCQTKFTKIKILERFLLKFDKFLLCTVKICYCLMTNNRILNIGMHCSENQHSGKALGFLSFPFPLFFFTILSDKNLSQEMLITYTEDGYKQFIWHLSLEVLPLTSEGEFQHLSLVNMHIHVFIYLNSFRLSKR